MPNPFETVILKLLDIGFYDFLLFLLALPILFAILKKTKMLGESPIVNGLIAFVSAFLIFSFPVITGVSLTYSMTNLFMQFMMFIIIILFAMIISSFFYPDLLGMLAKKFTHRTMLYTAIVIGLTLSIISGFLPTILTAVSGPRAPVGPVVNPDITNFVAGVIIFIVVLIVAAATTLRSE